MSKERNYQYELFLMEKENKELKEYIKELKEYYYDNESKAIIREKKSEKVYPSFVWSVAITSALYLILGQIREPFPAFYHKVCDILFRFEAFGVGCAAYFLFYWLFTRKIGRKS